MKEYEVAKIIATKMNKYVDSNKQLFRNSKQPVLLRSKCTGLVEQVLRKRFCEKIVSSKENRPVFLVQV